MLREASDGSMYDYPEFELSDSEDEVALLISSLDPTERYSAHELLEDCLSVCNTIESSAGLSASDTLMLVDRIRDTTDHGVLSVASSKPQFVQSSVVTLHKELSELLGAMTTTAGELHDGLGGRAGQNGRDSVEVFDDAAPNPLLKRADAAALAFIALLQVFGFGLDFELAGSKSDRELATLWFRFFGLVDEVSLSALPIALSAHVEQRHPDKRVPVDVLSQVLELICDKGSSEKLTYFEVRVVLYRFGPVPSLYERVRSVCYWKKHTPSMLLGGTPGDALLMVELYLAPWFWPKGTSSECMQAVENNVRAMWTDPDYDVVESPTIFFRYGSSSPFALTYAVVSASKDVTYTAVRVKFKAGYERELIAEGDIDSNSCSTPFGVMLLSVKTHEWYSKDSRLVPFKAHIEAHEHHWDDVDAAVQKRPRTSSAAALEIGDPKTFSKHYYRSNKEIQRRTITLDDGHDGLPPAPSPASATASASASTCVSSGDIPNEPPSMEMFAEYSSGMPPSPVAFAGNVAEYSRQLYSRSMSKISLHNMTARDYDDDDDHDDGVGDPWRQLDLETEAVLDAIDDVQLSVEDKASRAKLDRAKFFIMSQQAEIARKERTIAQLRAILGVVSPFSRTGRSPSPAGLSRSTSHYLPRASNAPSEERKQPKITPQHPHPKAILHPQT